MSENRKLDKYQQEHLAPDWGQKHSNPIITLQRENDIIQMLLEGKDSNEISRYIIQKYSIKKSTSKVFIYNAREKIKKRNEYELNTLINLHIHRYEKVYEELRELKANGIAISALQAKEKLLGFHREGFHLKVSQGEISAIQLQTVDSEYDVMKLDKGERTRFDELLAKCVTKKAISKEGRDERRVERKERQQKEWNSKLTT